MSWLTRYRTRLYFRYSMWISPAVGILLGWVTLAFFIQIDRAMGVGDLQGVGGRAPVSRKVEHFALKT